MTTATRYVAPIDARRHWRSYLGVACLLGLTVGLAFASIAGARRTQSAYPRFLQSVHAATVEVSSPGGYDVDVNRAVAAFPEVVQSRTYVAFNTYALTRDGRPDFDKFFEASGTLDGQYIDQNRFTPIEGRAADPERLDEVVINERAAELFGYRVGDHITVGTYSQDQIEAPTWFSDPPPPRFTTNALVVGKGVLPSEVLQDDADRTPRVLLTPAFSRRAKPYVTYGLQGLVLRHGNDDIDAIRRRMADLAPVGTVEYHVTAVDTFHTQQALRPLTIALGLFGVITGIAGLVLVGQALARVVRAQRAERTMLRAFGAERATLLRVALTGPAIAIGGGALLAIVLAIAVSPIMPIGPVRRVEVDPGFDADLTVLGLGALLVALVLLAFAGALAWRDINQRVPRRERARTRSARVVSAAAAAGMGVPAVTGLRYALEPGDGTTSAPSRSVIAGAAIAIAALVGALVFGASLDTLVHRPALYGWNWDAAVLAGSGFDNIPMQRARTVLDADSKIAAWSGAHFGFDTVDGHEVPLLGVEPDSAVLPPIVEGRSITNDREVLLGAATADRLDKHVGDTVTFAGDAAPRRATVVGIATFPTIGMLHAAHTSLGVGALVSTDLVPGRDRDITGQKKTGLGPSVIFLRFRSGVDPQAEMARLRTTTRPLSGFAGLEVLPVQRPAEIVNSSSIGAAPVLLASSLVVAAMVSLGLALAASVRRRRQDLTILKALGCTPRELGATVSWHATTTVGLGLVIGVPVGALLGHTLWDQFATQLDVVSHTRLPWPAIAATAIGAITIGNIVAALPARTARRVDPAHLLTSE